ncbi:type II toxin-antitoxin system YafO family toxin [Photorhabdus laumondii subsp. laumondii]|uniref:Photorhabdus luminescens subsp. laumondii TTO1 complete genome segment 11/17 n=3 Tax=Photorhabdus TaxID=29487 RepID=Q7N2D4_PHOLL|nr:MULTISPECIES: type II toxin-antitoxin system YafO family toxin [Photorhabdus]MBS9423463.1 type II toxin-antitoxin system YafO family toxin [Photorhabdus caribbeanensis]AWK42848.1 toxin [Photorhabdus laumondii subsp. laumondii]AXG43621.1 type II toxin-antitoxin system YafO family toxin [Photorhabdus laumondii subsp. laumondii]AXG48164.1 type II toxin-antitoxin system YafO family toxin [Photorhabdus laumondii subsp. laumondii]EYU15256.1 Toxin YafO, type II toxin-antitoxin system [Photorhabdus
MVRIFTYSNLKDALGEQKTKALVDDFKAYKEGKGLPITFGRDVPYKFTNNRSYLELQHLHYRESGFSLKLVQFRRTSGYVLVYCSGFFDRSTYLLIAIIKHWNHNESNDIVGTDRDIGLMDELEKIAERFREKF